MTAAKKTAPRTPQVVLRTPEPPLYGPPTRHESAVETAIARGYGGYVTDAEMAGPTPASSSPVTDTEANRG